jgi:hypothetical protein
MKPLYCAECGKELKHGDPVKLPDGSIWTPGYLPCPDHPAAKVTEKPKEKIGS